MRPCPSRTGRIACLWTTSKPSGQYFCWRDWMSGLPTERFGWVLVAAQLLRIELSHVASSLPAHTVLAETGAPGTRSNDRPSNWYGGPPRTREKSAESSAGSPGVSAPISVDSSLSLRVEAPLTVLRFRLRRGVLDDLLHRRVSFLSRFSAFALSLGSWSSARQEGRQVCSTHKDPCPTLPWQEVGQPERGYDAVR